MKLWSPVAERWLGLTQRMRSFLCVFNAVLILVFLAASASAQTLTGTVTNTTTNLPAAGDDVVLLSLGQGMQESGRTTTDAKGHFSLKLDDSNGPHLVRAIHQGVTYHRMAPPGTTSVEVQVYDVSKKVAGIGVTADVMRFQAQGNELQGVRLFAVDNKSNPPRTQMNDQNFEFYLPDGASIDQAMAMTAGGQPINASPVPQKEKNRYAFIFPLRPGETQFQVSFHMSYNGQASINPQPIYGSQHFVVMLPKSMQFSAGQGASFQSMQDPRQSDAQVEVASNTSVGQPLDFSVSGTGTLSEGSGEGGQQGGGEGGNVAGRDSRPGGGLGPPIDAPDPLERYRWYILGGFGAVLAAGAVYIVRRSPAVAVSELAASDLELPRTPTPAKSKASAAPSTSPAASPHSGMLLDALKEEIFQLELEHKQGRISQQEYEKAKAALDQTLERAVKRGARASSSSS
ncbi:MAG: carboxypeptidase regulatory-like domain-containing protein [Acidobacteriaceae bacterium]|nr:carboxypeptidase regulatory-like domain-containing protein [Acidobacteriaceae bacterium]